MHFPWSSLFNFLLLVGILAYYLRAPLKEFVSSRHDFLRDELVRVAQQLKSSQLRFDEFGAKLRAVEAEIQAIHDEAREEGDAIRVRLVNEARRVSQSIVADASVAAGSAVEELKAQLRAEFAGLIVDRAEAMLQGRLTGTDHERLRKEFSQNLGGAS